MWGATYISYFKNAFKKSPPQNRTNVQIKGGGGQRPFEKCSKKLHFFEMKASLTSVVFFSMLSLPSTVSFTTNSHVVRHVGSITKKSTTVTTAYHILSWRKFKRRWYILFVSDLPSPLIHVVFAVHSVVNHQTTWAKSRQLGYPRKGLSKKNKVLLSSCLEGILGPKSQFCQK